MTGVEDPDSRAHSANESLHIGDFKNAVVAEALLLARLNADGLALSSRAADAANRAGGNKSTGYQRLRLELELHV